jgi:hypothetical protein
MLWTVHTWEPRVGGAIHVSLMFEKGPYEVRGEFLQVDRPRRLRYRFGPDQIVDVTIDPNGSGSRVTVHHSGLGNPEMCGIITGGWTAGLGQLGTLLEPVGGPGGVVGVAPRRRTDQSRRREAQHRRAAERQGERDHCVALTPNIGAARRHDDVLSPIPSLVRHRRRAPAGRKVTGP